MEKSQSLLFSSSNLLQREDAEKLPFSAPRKPEVNEMRLFIEKNFFEKFRDRLMANPRFLISSGDSPVIYQVYFLNKYMRQKFNFYKLNLIS